MIIQRPFTVFGRPFRARIFVQFPNPGRCPGLTYFAPLGHSLSAPTGIPRYTFCVPIAHRGESTVHAPKGQTKIAQGNALGFRATHVYRALKGRSKR